MRNLSGKILILTISVFGLFMYQTQPIYFYFNVTYSFSCISDRIIYRLHRCKKTLSYTPHVRQVACFNDVIDARLLWMNRVLMMTSFFRYEWSCMFIRYYKKKVHNENISFHNFCSENNWRVICKKKNQTPAVGTDGNIYILLILQLQQAFLLSVKRSLILIKDLQIFRIPILHWIVNIMKSNKKVTHCEINVIVINFATVNILLNVFTRHLWY
jgi:hypothetical protein